VAVGDVESALSRLQAELPGFKDIPRERRTDADRERIVEVEQRIGMLRVNRTILDHLPDLSADKKWLGDLQGWRAELCTRLLEFPRVVRDKTELGRRTAIIYSLKTIEFGPSVEMAEGFAVKFLPLGQMMRDSGYEEIPPPASFGPNAVATMPFFGTEREVENGSGRLKNAVPTPNCRLMRY
jgi:hypothetical protein